MVSATKMKISDNILVSTNPGRGYAVVGQVAVSTQADIEKAVANARAAQPQWHAMGVDARVDAMRKVMKAIDENAEILGELTTAEMGMPITATQGTHAWAMERMEWFLKHAPEYLAPETTFENDEEHHQTYFEPWGVAAVIVPWNFPISNFMMGAFQPLLAGNTVVYKASEEVPLFSQKLTEIVQAAGLPHGVFNTVYGGGDVGEALARADVDLIGFTGSTAVGRKLYQIAAEKFIPAHLELGGSDAGIVCDDADVDAMVESIFWSKFINCGQICCGLKRLLVQENKMDETINALKAVVESKKQGDPCDVDTDIGPLAAERQLRLLDEQVQDARTKGAKFICGGQTASGLNGAYYEPTLVINVTKDMRIWHEEVFGPVLPIMTFKTDDEAIQMANDTLWGLSGYVFTSDSNRAARIAAQMKTGSISHNGLDYSGPHNPFGGYKMSGMKRTGGKQGFRDACQVKTVCLAKK